MSQHSIIVTAFMQLLLQLLLAFAGQRHFTTSAIIHDILHTVDFAFVGFFHLAQIFCTHLAGGVGVIAVHIDESLKAVLLAAVIEPINRTLLINLAVILEEVLKEVVTDFLTRCITRCAKCIRNEAQVFFQRLCAVNNLQPGNQTTYDIILKIIFISDGDYVVLIRLKGYIFALGPSAACISQAFYVQRITAKHAAHGVRKQRLDIALQISLAHGYVLILHLRS